MKICDINENTTYADLSPKQQQAIDKVIECDNQTEAYRIIQPKAKNNDTLVALAGRFFRNSSVARIRQERRLELLRQAQMQKEDIIAGLEEIAQGKVKDQFSDITAPKDRINAYNSLAKIHGLMDQGGININNNMAVQFVNNMPED